MLSCRPTGARGARCVKESAFLRPFVSITMEALLWRTRAGGGGDMPFNVACHAQA